MKGARMVNFSGKVLWREEIKLNISNSKLLDAGRYQLGWLKAQAKLVCSEHMIKDGTC